MPTRHMLLKPGYCAEDLASVKMFSRGSLAVLLALCISTITVKRVSCARVHLDGAVILDDKGAGAEHEVCAACARAGAPPCWRLRLYRCSPCMQLAPIPWQQTVCQPDTPTRLPKPPCSAILCGTPGHHHAHADQPTHGAPYPCPIRPHPLAPLAAPRPRPRGPGPARRPQARHGRQLLRGRRHGGGQAADRGRAG